MNLDDGTRTEADLRRLTGRQVLVWSGSTLFVATLKGASADSQRITFEIQRRRRLTSANLKGAKLKGEFSVSVKWPDIIPFPGGFRAAPSSGFRVITDEGVLAEALDALRSVWPDGTPFPSGVSAGPPPGFSIITDDAVLEAALAALKNVPGAAGDDAALRVILEWQRSDPARAVLDGPVPVPEETPATDSGAPKTGVVPEALVDPQTIHRKRSDALNLVAWLQRHAEQCTAPEDPARMVANETVVALLNVARAAIAALEKVGEVNQDAVRDAERMATSWPVIWPAHKPSRKRVEERMREIGLASAAPVNLPNDGKHWDDETPANAFALAIRNRIQERRLLLEVELPIRQRTSSSTTEIEQELASIPQEGTKEWFAFAMGQAGREIEAPEPPPETLALLKVARNSASKQADGITPYESDVRQQFLSMVKKRLEAIFVSDG